MKCLGWQVLKRQGLLVKKYKTRSPKPELTICQAL